MRQSHLEDISSATSVDELLSGICAAANAFGFGQTADLMARRQASTDDPLLFGQAFYVRAGAPVLWEVKAVHGLSLGDCASLQSLGERNMIWAFDGRDVLPTYETLRTRLLAFAQLVGVFAVAAVERVLGAAPRRLDERQVIVLRFTPERHSTWKIAVFLGIFEDTAGHSFKRTEGLNLANDRANFAQGLLVQVQ